MSIFMMQMSKKQPFVSPNELFMVIASRINVIIFYISVFRKFDIKNDDIFTKIPTCT